MLISKARLLNFQLSFTHSDLEQRSEQACRKLALGSSCVYIQFYAHCTCGVYSVTSVAQSWISYQINETAGNEPLWFFILSLALINGLCRFWNLCQETNLVLVTRMSYKNTVQLRSVTWQNVTWQNSCHPKSFSSVLLCPESLNLTIISSLGLVVVFLI